MAAKEGWLVKAPMSVGSKHSSLLGGLGAKKSHRRYFRLDEGGMLRYFEGDAGGAKAKGEVEIGKDAVVRAGEGTASNTLLVIPYPGSKRELFLSAADGKEAAEWAAALEHVRRQKGGRKSGGNGEGEGEEEEEEEAKDSESSEEEQATDESDAESEAPTPSSPRGARSTASAAGGIAQNAWYEEWQARVKPRTRLPRIKYERIKAGEMDKLASTSLLADSVMDGYWNRRYFVLDDKLRYADTEAAFTAGKDICAIPLEVVRACVVERDDVNELKVFTLGATYTLRCDSAEDRDDWVDKLNRCHHLLRPVASATARPRGPVAVADKRVPDFLVGIKDKAPVARPQQNPAPPPPAPRDGDGDGDDVESCGTPSILANLDHAEAAGTGGGDANDDTNGGALAEDRFARLRALRKGDD